MPDDDLLDDLLELDYGEGKTRRQEEIDSAVMLGGVVLVVIAVLVVLATLGLWWLL